MLYRAQQCLPPCDISRSSKPRVAARSNSASSIRGSNNRVWSDTKIDFLRGASTERCENEQARAAWEEARRIEGSELTHGKHWSWIDKSHWRAKETRAITNKTGTRKQCIRRGGRRRAKSSSKGRSTIYICRLNWIQKSKNARCAQVRDHFSALPSRA